MPEETNKKLQYLKRDEVRTMEKDIARLREQESEIAREKIAQIRTGEETDREMERIEQSKRGIREREEIEAEEKRKEEELKRLEAERTASAKSDLAAAAKEEEAEKERLRAQFREAQFKEEERRRKFLEEVAAKAESRPPREIPPEVPKIPTPPLPAKPVLPLAPPLPSEAPRAKEEPPPPAPPPPPPPLPIEAPSKKPFKFPLPTLKIPRVQLPRINGYFPKKPSILEKIWIRIAVSLFVLAILATVLTFWYWYLVVRQEAVPEKTGVGVTIKEPVAPLAVIPVDAVLTLETSDPEEELPGLLSQTLKEEFSEGKFTRLLIRDVLENKFLGLKEFLGIFEVKTPENFYNNINNDFTLFIFSSLRGNQLGFAARTENPAVLRSILEFWEETLEEDSDNLFTFLGKDEIESSLFKKSAYKNTVIHYLSLEKENFGICWAITDNYFIFTSSGESIMRTIDKIKE